MYRQSLEGHELSIEQGTRAVPGDGYYYVLLQGTLVGRFKSLAKAQACFAERKKALGFRPREAPAPSPEEIRKRDMAALSNKRLLWTEEDFARVDRKTRGKKGTRSAG